MMSILRYGLTCLFFLTLVAAAGCRGNSAGKVAVADSDAAAAQAARFAPWVDGTIITVADLDGGNELVVHGYGLVVGLGANGSSEVPPAIQKLLADQMMKYSLAASGGQRSPLTPSRLFNDKDTAVVRVSAAIPPGVPKDTAVDVFVQALPQTQTLSLDGGVLWTSELSVLAARQGGAIASQPMALAAGSVFVNPFDDASAQSDAGRYREGRVLGGAKVTQARRLRLVLRQPNHALAKTIEDSINARFPSSRKVANATGPSFIEIQIPAEYRRDYRRFLDLVMYRYLRRDPGAEDAKARQLASDILLPTADHEEIALIWEAMGRQYVGILRDLFGSENAAASFYAARTAARLGDSMGLDVLLAFAQKSGSIYQLSAIAELGRANDVQASAALVQLLNSHNEMVRLAAYEALCESRYHGAIERHDVDGQFLLDIVPSNRDFTIYVSQTIQPKIVLFGQGIQVFRPMFFSSPDELITIYASAQDDSIRAYRRVGPRKILSDEFLSPPDVKSLILTLGQLPTRDTDRKIRGLGLSYSQIVGVLYRLTKDQTIPARFVLQNTDPASRIYMGLPSVGRPDTAELVE